MLKEFLVVGGIILALSAAVVGIPVSLVAIHIHGANEGIQQERDKMVERGMGRYVFSAETGKPAFVYGYKGDTIQYVEAK